jgi:hypothetical protein
MPGRWAGKHRLSGPDPEGGEAGQEQDVEGPEQPGTLQHPDQRGRQELKRQTPCNPARSACKANVRPKHRQRSGQDQRVPTQPYHPTDEYQCELQRPLGSA